MKTAFSGPIIVYGDRNPPGSGGSTNPDKAPSLFWGGTGIIDHRTGYNMTKYGAQGWGSNYVQVINQVPSALADNNIAAIQTPGSSTAALTLVSSSGAGITVTSAASTGIASGLTIASGTLIIDTAPGLVSFGLANLASGFTSVSLYDPTKSISRNVRITSGGNDTGITFTVAGYDLYGYAMTETITGANGGVASGAKAFKYITSATPSAAVATTVKIGTGDVFGVPLRTDYWGSLTVYWNSAQLTAATGYVAAVTTTATATTGDTRGTYATQDASDAAKRMQVLVNLPPVNLTQTGAFGVTQA